MIKKKRKKEITHFHSFFINFNDNNYVNVLYIDTIIYIITYNLHVVLAGHGQSNFNTFVNLIVI